ncbi:MAG: polysaccharide pyruvyl transferase family protein [bacterium]|nr:polysaccharide pyruvyl transferase family protein [bacterium]
MNLLKQIFSVRNEKKHKVVTILGVRIKLYFSKCKKYFITGGGFNNKGAESMLYTMISWLKENDSNCKIIVQVKFTENAKQQKKYIDAQFIKNSFKELEEIIQENSNFIKRLIYRFKTKTPFLKTIKHVDAIFDISGFSISSEKTRTINNLLLYKIQIAKLYGKKMFLMPQSIGPIDFDGSMGITKESLKEILKYPKIIFCREKEGYRLLKELGLNNIYLSNDMVLQNSHEYQGLYKSVPEENINCYDAIKPKSVLIIPNKRLFEHCTNRNYYDVYKTMINYLLSKGYNVCISNYDTYDIDLCKEFKQMFETNENVYFIESNINCIEFPKIFEKFEFLILSRFHSIVHAYKKYMPCIVLGWAIKYNELLQLLGQEKMMFDCRYDFNIDEMLKSIDYIEGHKEEIRYIIKQKVQDVQKNTCFDVIKGMF